MLCCPARRNCFVCIALVVWWLYGTRCIWRNRKSLVKTSCGHDVISVRPGSGISARDCQLLVSGVFNCHSVNLGLAQHFATKRGHIIHAMNNPTKPCPVAINPLRCSIRGTLLPNILQTNYGPPFELVKWPGLYCCVAGELQSYKITRAVLPTENHPYEHACA